MASNENGFGVQRPRLSSDQTSALENMRDVYPMPSVAVGRPPVSDELYEGFQSVDNVPAELYKKYDVKRGLRNADGSGVLVGLTTISNVHGYNKTENGIEPDEGRLTIRGYDIADLVHHAQAEDRFGYEEVSYLLLTGSLPSEAQLVDFRERIDSRRQLPTGYLHVFPRTTASTSIMNILQQSTLLLYSFDPTPDDTSPEHEIDVAVSQLARLPRVAAIAYAAHRANKFGEPLFVPPVREGYSMAETVLDVLRGDEGFTHDEAMLLDVMLMLHAEHGGGNNSSFTCRVLSSSGTDAYSAYAAAIGSLKGPKHGGANYKAGEMIQDIGYHVRDWADDEEIYAYLSKILRKEAFDGKGRHNRQGVRAPAGRPEGRGGEAQPHCQRGAAGPQGHARGSRHHQAHLHQHRHVHWIRVLHAGCAQGHVHADLCDRAHVRLGGPPHGGALRRRAHHPSRVP